MSVTWSDVVAFPAPELAGVASGAQAAILAYVDRQIDPDVWGDYADDGRRYLAAHLASQMGATGSGAGSAGTMGPVTSETLGPMSRSYGALSGSTEGMGELAATKYGREYYRLLRIALAIPGYVP